MRVVLAGGSGLVGCALSARLIQAGHEVVVLTRGRHPITTSAPRVVTWTADGATGPWASELEGAGAIVNLSGAGIADKRWTPARKALLRSSRVLPTTSLVAAVAALKRRPPVFLQCSGTGYYGATSDDRERDETSPPGSDFLADVCVEWEAAAQPAAALGCRLVFVRTAPIVAPRGGMLDRLRVPFLAGLGGPIGSGRQYMSWIHIDDWTRLAEWAIAAPTVSGPLNASAPQPVTNAVFLAAYAHALRRPSWLPVPPIALRFAFGEMADAMLIKGQRVLPRRPLELGFVFGHPAIGEAMQDVVAASRRT